MTIYRTTTAENPLEMPAIEVYYDDFNEALRDAVGAAVSPVGDTDPWETVTVSRETHDGARTYTLTWTGTFSQDITTTVTIEELDNSEVPS